MIAGKPLIEWVYQGASRVRGASRVLVATDDIRIAAAVRAFGGDVVMTRGAHETGTDRVAEAAALPEAMAADVVVNIQGDQPLIDPDALDGLVAAFDEAPAPSMATLFEPLRTVEDLLDPNVAKVIADRSHNAIYFSRAPIPFFRPEGAPMRRQFETQLAARPEGLSGYWKHVGVYAFRKEFLFEFGGLPRGPLEIAEGLEQLRALESGHRIKLVRSAGVSISVETPDDLKRVESIMGGA